MAERQINIFEYNFNWIPDKKGGSKNKYKDECCDKYLKKGEKKCKKCPKRAA